MKAAIAFAFVTIFVALSAGQTQSHGNGRPDCSDPFHFTRFWRNNWDPNSYFRCDTAGVPATVVRCQRAFIEQQQRCGDWEDWVWRTPFDPPHFN